MKNYIRDFFRRGLIACGFGPLVLAILYLILQSQAGLETLTVSEVCRGIISLSALAFIAGGMNTLYQIERLPLMAAILIHCVALYLCYLATYLLNGWLQRGAAPIFVLGYLLIWAIIYSVTKRNTAHLNRILKEKQKKCDTR